MTLKGVRIIKQRHSYFGSFESLGFVKKSSWYRLIPEISDLNHKILINYWISWLRAASNYEKTQGQSFFAQLETGLHHL